MRIGFGYDVHKLVPGRDLWLGGIKIEHDFGLLGHSDADVLIHALCDALLGAAALRDIGYHFVIYRDGSVHAGRPIEQIGAHTSGYNANSIGICYIGGCAKDGKTPKDTRTEAQRSALVKLVAELRAKFSGATVHGHNEFANKACPSFNVQKDPDLCAK